jgi:hypothetical protein
MTLTGHIIGGQIVLDGPLSLPEGAAVRVEVMASPIAVPEEAESSDERETLRERLKNFLSHSIDLPEDAAENHDHYLYGTPKHGLPDR